MKGIRKPIKTFLIVLNTIVLFIGCDGGSDSSDDVNTPPPPLVVSRPELLTPINNEMIPQNNPNIGCQLYGNGNAGFGFETFFDWTDSDSPNGIKGYHLFVMNINARIPAVDVFVLDSEYTDTNCNAFVIDSDLEGWMWSVQAEDNLGNLSPVAEGEFSFEPCRLDDGTQCRSSQ